MMVVSGTVLGGALTAPDVAGAAVRPAALPQHAQEPGAALNPLRAGPLHARAPGHAPSGSAGPVKLRPPRLPRGGRYLSLGETLHVQGQAMTGWIYEAPGDIGENARWLSTQLPVLRDLLVGPGLVVLAGMDAHAHWSARLTDAGHGWTRGTLSRLPFQQSCASPPAAPWQPAGARLQFDVRWREGKSSFIQQVWTHAGAAAVLRTRLRADLLRGGWHAGGTGSAWPGRWTKAAAELSIVVVEQPAGSGIVTVLGLSE